MLRKRWLLWLVVLIAIVGLGASVSAMLAAQQADARPPRLGPAAAVFWATLAASILWTGWGLWVARGRPWAKWASIAFVGTIVVLLLTGVWIRPVFYLKERWPLGIGGVRGVFGLAAWGWEGTGRGIAGIWLMCVAFFVGLWFIRLILRPGHPVLGVARTLVDEAIRMKIALVFIALVFLLVPLLPAMLDPDERLAYRIQSFLSYSLMWTGYMLGLMTIFLAVGTITTEIKQRQIFLTMTKPVSRAQYLLGKWLGIALLDLLLVAIAGGGIYALTSVLRVQRAQDSVDRATVDHQVLVARETIAPVMPASMNMGELYEKRLLELQKQEPRMYGAEGTMPTAAARQQAEGRVMASWHTIAPGDQAVFRFEHLGRAQQFGDRVQLRFRPKATPPPPDDKVLLAVTLNGRPYPVYQDQWQPVAVKVNEYYVMDLPLSSLDEGGNLDVGMQNVTLSLVADKPIATVNFAPGEGLEVLYQVAGFESNLFKSLAMMWFNMVFLAVLGLAAGTFLGFPVASVLCLLVFVTASASTFLAESIGSFGGSIAGNEGAFLSAGLWEDFKTSLSQVDVLNVIKLILRVIGGIFLMLLPKLGHYDPVSLVSDGRMVSRELFVNSALWVGVVWSGLCALAAWLIFRERELARVTV